MIYDEFVSEICLVFDISPESVNGSQPFCDLPLTSLQMAELIVRLSEHVDLDLDLFLENTDRSIEE